MPILGLQGFGIFMIGLSAQLLILGIIDSALLTPLCVKASQNNHKDEKGYIARHIPLLLSISIGLSILSSAIILIYKDKFGLQIDNGDNLIFGIALGSFALCVRETVRQSLLIDQRLNLMLTIEIVISLAILTTIYFLPRLFNFSITAGIIFILLACINLLYIIIIIYLYPKNILINKNIINYQYLIKQGTPSLISAQITWLQSQSYMYFIGAMVSAAALGIISAGRMLFAPLQTIFTGIARGLLPDLANQYAKGDKLGFSKIIIKGYLWFTLLSASWTIAGIIIFPPLFSALAIESFTPDNALTISWGFVFGATGLRAIGSLGLKACGRFDMLMRQGTIGALASVITIPLLISFFGSIGALWGLFIGETFALMFASMSLSKQLKQVV